MSRPDAHSSPARSPFAHIALFLGTAAVGFILISYSRLVVLTHNHEGHTVHKKALFCSFTNCTDGNAQENVLLNSSASQSPPASNPPSPPPVPAYAYDVKEAETALTSRVCGSPAIDGYAHVVPKCLEDSPTAKWWKEHVKTEEQYNDLEVYLESAADFDGLAVFWGINNKKANAEECAAHCKSHRPGVVPGPFKDLPCNSFVWCSEEVCFEPDVHKHTKGDCWLKFTEGPAFPEVNMRGVLPPEYRKRHAAAPEKVQWVGGVLLPKGVAFMNGTWGPRWSW